MTTEIILWFAGYAVAGITVLITAYINLTEKILGNDKVLSNRMVKIETTIELIGLNSAKFLHRDDDVFRMDAILDKYIDRNYAMTWAEWSLLLEKCDQVKNNESVEIFYRFMAGQLAAVCHHKLQHTPNEKMKSKSIIRDEPPTTP